MARKNENWDVALSHFNKAKAETEIPQVFQNRIRYAEGKTYSYRDLEAASPDEKADRVKALEIFESIPNTDINLYAKALKRRIEIISFSGDTETMLKMRKDPALKDNAVLGKTKAFILQMIAETYLLKSKEAVLKREPMLENDDFRKFIIYGLKALEFKEYAKTKAGKELKEELEGCMHPSIIDPQAENKR